MEFHFKKFILLAFTFILFVPIGTLSHELGHGAAIKLLGYSAELHYASISYDSEKLYNEFEEIYLAHEAAIENNKDFQNKARYVFLSDKLKSDGFWITLGGPAQTIGFGTLAFLLLLYFGRKYREMPFSLWHWFLVFTSLFWLRFICNPFLSIGSELIAPNGSFFGGDERELAMHFNLWEGSVSLPLAFLGSIICAYVTFRVVPKAISVTFIAAALVGGSFGYLIWLVLLGPIVMP